MDVLICVADGLIFDDLDYADRIEQRLVQAGLMCGRIDLTDPMAYQSVRRPRPERAYVFTGGQTSVHSDAAWMQATLALMRELIIDARNGGPCVVGVCLGSQVIAEALRPGSIVGTSGIEVGLTPVRRPPEGESDQDGLQVVPSFHYQAITPQITDIDGVRIEYCNDHTAVQALSYGERVFGCQYHPELDPDDMHRLIDFNKDVIAEWNGDTVAAHRSVEEHQGALSGDLFHQMVTSKILR